MGGPPATQERKNSPTQQQKKRKRHCAHEAKDEATAESETTTESDDEIDRLRNKLNQLKAKKAKAVILQCTGCGGLATQMFAMIDDTADYGDPYRCKTMRCDDCGPPDGVFYEFIHRL